MVNECSIIFELTRLNDWLTIIRICFLTRHGGLVMSKIFFLCFSFFASEASRSTVLPVFKNVQAKWEEYASCFDNFDRFKYPEKMSVEILKIVCDLKEITGEPLTVLSDWRIKGQHPNGLALDFFLSHFDGKTYCEKMKLYNKDFYIIEKFLKNYDHYNSVGFGGYSGFFFHLDARGKKAQWFRIKGKDYSHDYGKRWLRNQLRKCEG